jgi:hypothetical protein
MIAYDLSAPRRSGDRRGPETLAGASEQDQKVKVN